MPRVSAKRQITLPVDQCREVGIGPGDEYRSFVVDGRITIVRKTAGAAKGFSEPNIRFEDDQVVWRALQAYCNAAPAGGAPLAKGAGFPDALIVFKALRLGSDDGESLRAAYTFDAAMRALPHTAPLQ